MLLTSAGRRAGLLDCFRQSAAELGLPLRVLACDLEPDWSAACHRADARFAVPRVDDPGYVDALLAIVRAEGVGLVVPTIDTELSPLADARAAFEAAGARVHVGASEDVAVARDKLKTAVALERAGVPVPWTMAIEAVEDPEALAWPLFLKPSGGSASRGIQIVRVAADLPASSTEPMVLQQLLEGPEYTVNVFVDAAGRLRCVVPHRRVRVRAGEVEKGVTERDPLFDLLAEGVGKAMPGLRGAACFQLILDRSSGPRVFEINARFGGGYPLAHEAGAPFARWLLEETAGLASSCGDGWQAGVTMLRYDAAVFIR